MADPIMFALFAFAAASGLLIGYCFGAWRTERQGDTRVEELFTDLMRAHRLLKEQRMRYQDLQATPKVRMER
jgi:hypothetical protein